MLVEFIRDPPQLRVVPNQAIRMKNLCATHPPKPTQCHKWLIELTSPKHRRKLKRTPPSAKSAAPTIASVNVRSMTKDARKCGEQKEGQKHKGTDNTSNEASGAQAIDENIAEAREWLDAALDFATADKEEEEGRNNQFRSPP